MSYGACKGANVKLLYKRKGKFKMMNNENGRSMVEMLGVLAIIGVLSVAGIAGYSMAMRKYRTNEVLNAASQLVILAQAKSVSGGNATETATLGDLGVTSVAGLDDMTATCTGSNCTVESIRNDDDVWKAAVAATGSGYYTIVS